MTVRTVLMSTTNNNTEEAGLPRRRLYAWSNEKGLARQMPMTATESARVTSLVIRRRRDSLVAIYRTKAGSAARRYQSQSGPPLPADSAGLTGSPMTDEATVREDSRMV